MRIKLYNLLLLATTSLISANALAQQGGGVGGAGAEKDLTPHAASTIVGNNLALKALLPKSQSSAVRLGFTTAGDGGYAIYNASMTNCNLPDDGAQVQPTGGIGCWIADFSNVNPVPEVWGAKGDGTTNDAAAINSSLLYLSTISGRLHSRIGSKYGIASTVTVKSGTSFVGAGWDDSQIKLLNGAFSPAIKMEGKTEFTNWYVDATPQNLSGIVIQMEDIRSLVSRVLTYKGCIALDVNGVSHTVRDSEFSIMAATAGCGGVRVGHNTQGGTIELRIVDSLMKCDFAAPTRADYGLLLEDSGGSFFSNTDNIGCIRGTVIKPGANQSVEFSFFNNSVVGDSAQEEGLLIDTGAVSAKVRSNSFVNTWTSGAPAPGGTGIIIQNTGGGTIDGTSFVGHRSHQNYFNSVWVKTPAAGTITDTSFDMLRVCNTQVGTNFLVGDNLDIAIRNSRLGKQCDGYTAGNTTGLLYGVGIGANVQLIATGNDLSYMGGETWAPLAGVPTRNSVIANNSTDVAAGPTYTAASTVTLLQTSPRIHLAAAGAATVNTITPAWNGQPLCIIGENLAGAITFSTSGNIRYPVTIPTGGGMVCGYYDAVFSKWILK